MATVSGAPDLQGSARYQTVEQALEAGPVYFTEIMDALGSRGPGQAAAGSLRDPADGGA